MIKAIVFDFDGTIIDTETAWYVAFRDAYKEHGVDLTLELYSQCIGTSLHAFNPYDYLVTHLHMNVDLDELRTTVRARHAALMEEQTVRPGIMAYLNAARGTGLQIGLASSSNRAWVNHFLEHLGLQDYFSCIRTADDVERVKPDPAVYVKALEGLGVEGCEAIAIEDSPNGAKAAVAAGLYTVVVPNPITKRLPIEDYHIIADSLEDVDFHRLLSQASSRVERGAV